MTADITAFTLDDSALPPPTPEIEQERNIAIFDLLEANTFFLKSGAPGPYALTMGLRERVLTFTARTDDGGTEEFTLPYSPFRKAARAYFTVCESYLAAVRTKGPEDIAKLDEGRKALHDEGAILVTDRLSEYVEIDDNTARRLFTLIGSLYIR